MFNGKFPFPPSREAWEISLPGISRTGIPGNFPFPGNFPRFRNFPGNFPGKFPRNGKFPGNFPGNSRISGISREFPEIREIPEPREIPETREFPRLKLFPPVSQEMGISREFPTRGFPLNIPAMNFYAIRLSCDCQILNSHLSSTWMHIVMLLALYCSTVQ